MTTDNALVLVHLLERGQFDRSMLDAAGDTTLYAAVRKGRRDMVCLLLSHGSNRRFPNGEDVTPLDLALATDRDLAALLQGDACLPQAP